MATGVWLLGVGVLGTRWEGVEVAPGIWRDAIPLSRWLGFWAGLCLVGVLLASLLVTWPTRLLAIVPVVVWYAVELSSGTLAPVAWLVYVSPTLVAWLVGHLVGDLVRGRWHGA